jgi:hypothetical protein
MTGFGWLLERASKDKDSEDKDNCIKFLADVDYGRLSKIPSGNAKFDDAFAEFNKIIEKAITAFRENF